VLLEHTDSLEGGSCRVLDALLVVRLEALDGAEPATDLGEDLLVGEGQPLQDGGIVLLGLAEERRLLVLGGDCAGRKKVEVSLLSNDGTERGMKQETCRSMAVVVAQSVNTCLNKVIQSGITV
jgi:hypothetical protein